MRVFLSAAAAAAAAATNVVAAWVVDYYRPSCPPCRRLRSELRRLSRSLSSQIRITLVNCGTQIRV